MSKLCLDVGMSIAIPKLELDIVFANLRAMGYDVIGQRVKDHAIIPASINGIADLPRGYISQQEAGKYRLVSDGHKRYFDITSGPQSWKQYFFPSRTPMMSIQRDPEDESKWTIEENDEPAPSYALVGVRPCDLAAIKIQDRIFMREEWSDPIYQARRTNAFILAVNCLHPSGTCFCVSMGTGPKAESGFDLCLTELDEVFLIEIGSKIGLTAMTGEQTLSWQPASDSLLQSAQDGLDKARQEMGRVLPDPEELPDLLLNNLEHPQWDNVARRCLSCGSCTLVCPTCFCWDANDQSILFGDNVTRERVWDSCYNPDYSYVFGGNTRPNTRSRYRQWLTHKFASWQHQFGTSGCVGCGRCITWCPAGIDPTEEIASIREANQT